MKKILILTNRIPYPLNDGGNLAVYNSLEMYLELGYEVHLLTMNTSRHHVHIADLPDFFKKLSSLTVLDINNDLTVAGAIKSLIKNESYHISRFIDEAFTEKLTHLLRIHTFDFVQLEGLFVTPYLHSISENSNAVIIYRQHNIEHQIWERKAQVEKHLIKKFYFKKLASQLKIYETTVQKRLRIICPISQNDYDYNQSLNPEVTQFYWPFTPKLSHEVRVTPIENQTLKLYHIGAMDWLPNQEAVDWLLDEIFPEIHKQCPQIELYIAGRNMPEKYFKYNKNLVHVVGEVEDSYDFQKDKHVLIIPLKSASGQRIKFIEAMQNMKCIISTDVGKSDIKAENQKHYIRANDTKTFVEAVIHIYQNHNLYIQLCTNAYEQYDQLYSFNMQKEKLNTFLNKF